MTKVTYLLGAGASAGYLDDKGNGQGYKLPVVNGFRSAIDSLTARIITANRDIGWLEPMSHLIDPFLEDLEWLLQGCEQHASVDTFARKLHLQHEINDLRKLKSLVNAILLYYQLKRGNDLRYDSLIASLLQGTKQEGISFPGNVRFLSWNYDVQVETSFHNLTRRMISESIDYIPYSDLSCQDRQDKGILLKLNGSINTFLNKGGGIDPHTHEPIMLDACIKGTKDDDAQMTRRILVDILNQHSDLKKRTGVNALIQYAWEGNDYSNRVRMIAQNRLADTNILVVIGYSFPTFNRNIDREIIRKMSGLHKVYFQDPYADDIIDRFGAIRHPSGIEFKPIKDTSQFVVPYEL